MLELIISTIDPRRIERRCSALPEIRREVHLMAMRSKIGLKTILVTGHDAAARELNALLALAELPPFDQKILAEKYDIPLRAIIGRDSVTVNGAPLALGQDVRIPGVDAEAQRANDLDGAVWVALDRLRAALQAAAEPATEEGDEGAL